MRYGMKMHAIISAGAVNRKLKYVGTGVMSGNIEVKRFFIALGQVNGSHDETVFAEDGRNNPTPIRCGDARAAIEKPACFGGIRAYTSAVSALEVRWNVVYSQNLCR